MFMSHVRGCEMSLDMQQQIAQLIDVADVESLLEYDWICMSAGDLVVGVEAFSRSECVFHHVLPNLEREFTLKKTTLCQGEIQ